MPIDGSDECERLARRELIQAVRTVLTDMPERHRQPLVLHFLGGLDYPELAASLGCTVNHARVKVHRSLGALRKRLGRIGLACSLAALAVDLPAAVAEEPAPVAGTEQIASWTELLTSQQATPGWILPAVSVWPAASLGLVAGMLITGGAVWWLVGWEDQRTKPQMHSVASSRGVNVPHPAR